MAKAVVYHYGKVPDENPGMEWLIRELMAQGETVYKINGSVKEIANAKCYKSLNEENIQEILALDSGTYEKVNLNNDINAKISTLKKFGIRTVFIFGELNLFRPLAELVANGIQHQISFILISLSVNKEHQDVRNYCLRDIIQRSKNFERGSL